jgi:hypothetical protein
MSFSSRHRISFYSKSKPERAQPLSMPFREIHQIGKRLKK